MFAFLLGLVFGFICCLYYLVLQKNKTSSSSSSSTLKGVSFYCNFLIIDKSVIVKSTVEEKLQSKIGQGYLRNKLINKVSDIAVNKVKDDVLSNKIVENIITVIPLKINELGILVEATKVYCKDSLFIVKLTILNVDLQKIITKKAGEEKGNKIEEMFKLLGGQWAKDTIGAQLLPIICNKLQEKLPDILKEKFTEKGLVIDVEVKSESEEAAFFFELLEKSEN